MTTVGEGEYRYDLVESWGQVPPGLGVGVVTGVVVDSQDRVYFCQQQQNPPILVFDGSGTFLDSWGEEIINEPHTMFIDREDIIYLADRGDHVALKLTTSGGKLLELGTRGQPSDTGCFEDEAVVLRAGGPFNRPTRLSPSPSGDLYVSDGYRNSRVHRFSSQGELIASWGEPGTSAPSEFFSPHCLWIDGAGNIYVCDRKNNRIQIFSPEGEFLTQWTNVRLPTDLHIDSNGVFYLAERESNESPDGLLTVRDGEGKVMAQWSTPRSHQIWPDNHGDIYLVSGTGRKTGNGIATKYIKV
ncbi:MAG: hypothetical protein BZY81_07095 [SAR202 cluster bacterium Io17-Chloro-G4]|nr:MAG: hypothetical protein BZY81_07095 [SAR202 cluster bacterium Io17-Chloro-G4]